MQHFRHFLQCLMQFRLPELSSKVGYSLFSSLPVWRFYCASTAVTIATCCPTAFWPDRFFCLQNFAVCPISPQLKHFPLNRNALERALSVLASSPAFAASVGLEGTSVVGVGLTCFRVTGCVRGISLAFASSNLALTTKASKSPFVPATFLFNSVRRPATN